MVLLLEKTETKNEVVYKIKPKLWYGGGVLVLILFMVGIIYRMKNPYLFLGGFLILFLWVIMIVISLFPIWYASISSKTITKEGGPLIHARVWKIKKV